MLMNRSFGATPKDVAHIEKKTQRKCLLKVELSDVVEQDDVLGKLCKLKDNNNNKKTNITVSS